MTDQKRLLSREIRAHLLHKDNEDGRTASEIARVTRSRGTAVTESLTAMVDAYIDRWQWERNRWTAVWTVAVIPENCPKPEREGSE